eukprot:TRINITY_DN57563_c0_g1_i1.p1 TRINITY_DN57563_c0_g1~~TRINITY_DN57563_c0_g1_i1.p1  ORF type:complete len:397 (+),score=119.69 TRINITY_DN57563_c0_g1_i1:84-1274(+)
MTVIKGEKVSLDDLLGISRLQDVLTKIIAHMNEQDESVGKIQVDAARAAIAQEAALKKMREEVDAATKKLDAQDKNVKESIAGIEKKVEDAVKQVKTESEARQAQQAKTNSEIGQLQAKQKEAKVKVDELDADFGKQRKEIVEMKEELARMGKVDQKVDELTGDLAKIKAVAEKAEEAIRSEVLPKFVSIEQSVQSLRDALEAADKKNGAAIEEQAAKFQEQLVKVDADFKAADEELKKLLADSDADNKQRIQKVDDALKAYAERNNVRGMVEALQKKLNSEIAAIRDELGPLAEALKNMSDEGSSATVRCLTCATKKPTMGSSFTIGTDGKTYFRSSDGNNVNLGRVNLPSLQGGVNQRNMARSMSPGSRSLSPQRTQQPKGIRPLSQSYSAARF